MTATYTLYHVATPNGIKPHLVFEELKEAYPDANCEYKIQAIDFQKNEQKEPWFLKINPNGRIPALTHHRADGSDFHVFESAAILIYLTQKIDTEHKLSFPSGSDYESEALQWIFFAHGGVGPMQGQANHFFRYAPEKIPYGIKRYQDETKRLYSVLETRLTERDWLVGDGRGKYSIADINVWPWVKSYTWALGIEELTEFPHVSRWIKAIQERPAALRAAPPAKPRTKEEEEKAAQEASKWIMNDKQTK